MTRIRISYRLGVAAALVILICARAHATNLLNLTVTAPIATTTTTALQFPDGKPRSATVQANFTYGSGGTSVDAYVQTTLDGGATWTDIANFHFTTASARKAINLSSLTPVTTAVTATDGTLAANTAVDGLIGSQLKVKYASTGTYGGGTTLTVNVTTTRVTQ